MKIVFLSCTSGLAFRGGETVCDALAKHLSARHDVTVFQPKIFEQGRPYRMVEIPIVVGDRKAPRSFLRHFRLDRAYRKMLLFAIRAIWKCLFLRPDIIVPINGSWVALFSKIYASISKAKLVISGQSAICPDPLTLKIRPDLFVCLSQPGERCVRRIAPKQKTVIIPNGVDLNLFAPKPKSNPYGLPRPIVLCAAGPDRYKNVQETIQAVSRLDGVSLLVMGGNRETSELGAQLLGSRYRQAMVPHDRMPEICNCADVFTLASESSEAFGIVYVEAMACNLPVVATDDELRREIVGPAGVFVKDVRDPAAYAAALKAALEEDWGNRPRRRAEKFGWAEIARQYENEFSKLSS